MKKILYITLSFVMLLITSCDKYLDVVPDNVSTLDNAFSNEYEASKYLATCYSYMPNFGSVHGNPGFFCGDEAWLPEATLENKTVDAWKIARGTQGTTEPILNFWSGKKSGSDLFDGIRHCNTFIENVPNVLGLDEEKVLRWKSEVRFLKAYYMFWLVRNYGPIPLFKENIAITSTDGIFQERQKIDDCFNYIVEEIDASLDGLPLFIANSGEELGRVTLPAALAIKARILTTAASPLFNGNTEFESLVNAEGEPLFSPFDANKWVKANEAIDAALESALMANHKLFEADDYKSLVDIGDTLKLECALRSAVSEKYNPEVLWASAKSYGSDIQDRAFARLENNYYNQLVPSNLAPTMRIAEQFYSDKGVPIDEDIDWPYADRYKIRKGDHEHRYVIKEGEQTAGMHFNREPRFYSSLGFDRCIWYGAGKFDPVKGLHVVKTRGGEPAGINNPTDYSITGYWPKKLVHIKSTVSSDRRSLIKVRYTFPIMRLADLYLLKAEVANEIADAPTQEVFDYVDMVRTRAGLNGVKESWTNYSKDPGKFQTKSGMREIIHTERLIELCMEGRRFWDLRRWRKSHIYMNKAIRGWKLGGIGADEFYQQTVLFSPTYSTKDYFWPIQEYRIVENPKLIQNKGW